MNVRMQRSLSRIASVAFTIALMSPVLSFAQTDLQATIRAEILRDPRTSSMSQAQVEAMVATLSQNAQAQGLTPQDITWKPTGDVPVSTNFCAPYPAYLCLMSEAFGFIGGDYLLPLWLAVISLLFLIVNALHKHHERINEVIRTTTVPPAPLPPVTGQNLQ